MIKDIPIDLIDEPREDLRAWRDPAFEELLGEDLEKEGLLVYPIVRSKPNGRFEIIDGVTRIRDLKRLGKDSVPCDVRECDDRDALIMALKVGIKRKSQDPMGLARAFKRLKDQHGMKQREIAEKFGFTEGYTSKLMALNRLSPEDQLALAQGRLNIEQAYAMASKRKAPLGYEGEPLRIGREELPQPSYECEGCGARFEFYETMQMKLCRACRDLLTESIAKREKEARKRLELERAQQKLPLP